MAPSSQESQPPKIPERFSRRAETALSQRDGHVCLIREQGRSTWRKATGYGRRSLAETAVGRYKALIEPQLRARSMLNQQAEVGLGVEVLNRMIRVAKPASVRIA